MEFRYDNTGNVASDSMADYRYNDEGRLQSATSTSDEAYYAYYANGQRATKRIATLTIPTTTTTAVYHYGQSGLLLSETAATGAQGPEYLYLNGEPLAKVDGGMLTYIHPDHLGSPQSMTSTAGSKVWEIEARPFGDETTVAGTATLNLRFPGQYFDAETGLHQNWWRDYSPPLGRFMSADPDRSPDRDVNPYSYVRNDPVVLTDVRGLSSDLPGYIHSSIPELTVNDGRVRPDETQGAARLVRETDTTCFYATGSLTRFAAALIGITKSRIQAACRIKRPIKCPQIQAFFVNRSVDAVIIGRVNVYCDQVTKCFDYWERITPEY